MLAAGFLYFFGAISLYVIDKRKRFFNRLFRQGDYFFNALRKNDLYLKIVSNFMWGIDKEETVRNFAKSNKRLFKKS